MSQLRDRMIEDLRLRGRAENTINTYVPCVSRFFEWAGVTPNKVDAGIVRAFFLNLVNVRRLSPSSHDVYAGAIKFFFQVTMRRPEVVADLVRRKVPMTLTLVPSRAQIAQLIDSASNVKHQAMFMTLYGAGLRVSELRGLYITDIDSPNMVIHIRKAKRHRVRDALLGPQLLSTCKPATQYRNRLLIILQSARACIQRSHPPRENRGYTCPSSVKCKVTNGRKFARSSPTSDG